MIGGWLTQITLVIMVVVQCCLRLSKSTATLLELAINSFGNAVPGYLAVLKDVSLRGGIY